MISMAKNDLKTYVCKFTLAWPDWYDFHHKLSLQPKMTSHEPRKITDTHTSEVIAAWIIEQVSAPLLGMILDGNLPIAFLFPVHALHKQKYIYNSSVKIVK